MFELLHGSLSELIGVSGDWTLVPRQREDTDEIFHGLKAQQIATLLTTKLAQARDAATEGATSTDAAESTSAEAAPTDAAAEPAALPWSPAPISVWAEPERTQQEQTQPVRSATEQRSRLVA